MDEQLRGGRPGQFTLGGADHLAALALLLGREEGPEVAVGLLPDRHGTVACIRSGKMVTRGLRFADWRDLAELEHKAYYLGRVIALMQNYDEQMKLYKACLTPAT